MMRRIARHLANAVRNWGTWLVGSLPHLLVLLILAGSIGFLVAASGIVPIEASAGHWPITKWFLSFSMRRSVKTHSLDIKTPPLDDPDLVLKGAAHFETGCSPCHGSPSMHQPRIAAALTPTPPSLSATAPLWEPEELFYIVKHGVKMTGMPAWPSQQRDDEVWAMTAFLLELPQIDRQQYRELVRGAAAKATGEPPLADLAETESPPPAIVESCIRCHRADGLGRGEGVFPVLAGQNEAYLVASLRAFAAGKRHSGVMEPIAAPLDDDEVRQLASYYANRSPTTTRRNGGDAEAIRRGEELAAKGKPENRIPACNKCHSGESTSGEYPVLAGQYEDYLRLQLDLYKKDVRGGTKYAHIMQPIAARLTKEQIDDVAVYYATHTHGEHAER